MKHNGELSLARKVRVSIVSAALILTGCAPGHPTMDTVSYVNIERMMGDWYVIANIPTFIETGAHNAIERYERGPENEIRTTFSFRDGGFDGPLKQYTPTGYIEDTETNARWAMQFVWPFRADYRIVYLDDDYRHVVVARQARDYAWIMSRAPRIEPATYERLVRVLVELGYERNAIVEVPQRWPAG
ncbi:MAG: lipocalin family protein [Pseudomonadota bacterium]